MTTGGGCVAFVPVCQAVGADPVERESHFLQLRHDSGDRRRVSPDIRDHVAVLADLRRNVSALERMQKDHLTPNHRPGCAQSIMEIHQDMPELVDRWG